MIYLKRERDDNYNLTVKDDKGNELGLKLNWKELGRLFCLIAKEVCRHINTE